MLQESVSRKVRGTVFTDASVKPGQKVRYEVTRVSREGPVVRGTITVTVD